MNTRVCNTVIYWIRSWVKIVFLMVCPRSVCDLCYYKESVSLLISRIHSREGCTTAMFGSQWCKTWSRVLTSLKFGCLAGLSTCAVHPVPIYSSHLGSLWEEWDVNGKREKQRCLRGPSIPAWFASLAWTTVHFCCLHMVQQWRMSLGWPLCVSVPSCREKLP